MYKGRYFKIMQVIFFMKMENNNMAATQDTDIIFDILL